MKHVVLGFCVALIAGCGNAGTVGAPPSPATPANSANGLSPLEGTFDGRPFTPRGIVARPMGRDAVLVFVFDRPAECGTPSASQLPGERHFQIHIPSWPAAANGMHIELWNSPAAVNTVRVQPTGNGASATAMGGSIDVLSAGPAGGTVVVHARNEEGTLHGQVPFAICR